MSDAFLGVLIGGFIGCITPLLTLRYSERRWRFEAKIKYLKSERDRYEKLYENAIELFASGAANNSYPITMISDFLVIFPKDLSEIFEKHMKTQPKTEEYIRSSVLEIAAAMRRDIRKRDEEIQNLLAVATTRSRKL